MRRSPVRLGAFVLTGLVASSAAAQDPAKFYEDNCSSCHTIGQGVVGGPDLKGITARRDRDWVIRFLLNPDAFANDPVVVQMIKEADGLTMGPTDGLTRELADAIITWIENQPAGEATGLAETFSPLTPEEAARGRTLFTGDAPLEAGGPACVACHAGGDVRRSNTGRLGPDLSNVSGRLGGARGVIAWLKATQSPMMRGLYKDARIRESEARALTAFLEMRPPAAGPPLAARPHVLGGFFLGIVVLAAVGGAWTWRFRAVRRPLVDEALRNQASAPAGRPERHTLGGSR